MRRCQERERREERAVVATGSEIAQLAVEFDELGALQHDEHTAIWTSRKLGAVERRTCAEGAAAGEASAIREFDVGELPRQAHEDFRDVVAWPSAALQTELANGEIGGVAVEVEAEDVGKQSQAQKVIGGVRESGGEE